MTAARRVTQALPVNYAGIFTSDDPFLEKLWDAGAYTTRACLVAQPNDTAYLGSILINRGDRVAFLGDAYVAQATLLAAFGNVEIANASLYYTAAVGNSIKPYDLMWVLTALDLYDFLGDASMFAPGTAVSIKLETVLTAARDSLVPAARNLSAALRWSRDDERMGYGWEFCDAPFPQHAYRALAAEAWRRAAAAPTATASAWAAAYEEATQWEGATWYPPPSGNLLL